MLKRKLFLVWVAWLPSYCYSDSIAPYYGQTGNAASSGYVWSMDNVLPSGIPGLDINGVIYNYTVNKNIDDALTVHVQNQKANGTGYIFRETDDWLPGSQDGTQINKVVPVVPSNRALWGEGSIVTEGDGSVSDARVLYTYKVDPCYDPQFDPNCPGYQVQVPDTPQVDYEIYDATADAENTQYNPDDELYDDEEEMSDEEKSEKEAEEEKDSKERLEKALSAADNSAMFANALATAQMLNTVTMATNMNSYYQASIPGGVYKETVTLQDKQIPENKNGLRNGLAQQLLHEQMINMQYNKKQ